MTVPTLESVAEFSTNGVTTNFPFFFKFLANEDLVVTYVNPLGNVSVLALGTHYTVNGAGDEDGGSIVTTTAMAGPGQLVVSREMDAYQQTSLRNQGKFLAETHEDVFDRLTMLIQQGFSIFKRALVRPFGKPYYDAENRNISNLADPFEMQDAATKQYTQQYVGDLISQIQGPINNAANVFFLGANGIPGVVQDLSGANSLLMLGATLPDGTVGTLADYMAYLQKVPTVVLRENPGADRVADIMAAIVSMRSNPVSILDDIGGVTITAYSSGTLELGRGVFRIAANTLQIYQDLGLIIRGQGSRRTTNAVKGGTTILITGASNGYGIKFSNGGARGITLADLDVCYESATFTGDVVDSIGCPGFTTERVYIGTYGTTAGTRFQTARSCLRMSYYEFVTLRNSVFDGAVDHVWSDDVRVQNGNTGFVGSNVTIINCVFYDCTGKMIKYPGNRTSNSLNIIGCTFNPIAVNCVNAIDIRNVEGLVLEGNHFVGSVANHATSGWIYLQNVIAECSGNVLDDMSDAGTVSGNVKWNANRIACLEGLNVTGGVFTGRGNVYSKAIKAVTFSPAITLHFDVGPDLFKPQVGTSYNIPAESTSISGTIHYSLDQDGSVSKFINASSRVSIYDHSEQVVAVSANRSIVQSETGRHFRAAGAGAQTFGLPVAAPGLRFRVSKIVAQDLVITCQPGNNFYVGVGSTKTVCTQVAAHVGGGLTFESIGVAGWLVTSQAGTWSFT